MKRFLLVALAVGALVLGGCSVSRESAPASDEAPAAAPQGEAGQADANGYQSRDQAKAPNESVAATTGPVQGRTLIYRGDITVRVDDVEVAADKVESIASSLGGHISSQKRGTGSRDAHASITLRVPSSNFETALDRVAELGKEQGRGSTTEDVTEATVDLETRIAAQRASVESGRRMFDRATALNDVVLLERELSARQAELASLEAKKRRLDDLVALSTINISLAGPNTEIPVEKKRSPGFLGGLEAGSDAFVAAVQVVLVALGFLLPFLLALAIPLTLFLYLRRRRRPTPPPPPTPTP